MLSDLQKGKMQMKGHDECFTLSNNKGFTGEINFEGWEDVTKHRAKLKEIMVSRSTSDIEGLLDDIDSIDIDTFIVAYEILDDRRFKRNIINGTYEVDDVTGAIYTPLHGSIKGTSVRLYH